MIQWTKGQGYDDGLAAGKSVKVPEVDPRERFSMASKALARLSQLEDDSAFSSERAYWRGFLQAVFPRMGGWYGRMVSIRTPDEALEALAELRENANQYGYGSNYSLDMIIDILEDLNEKVERLGKIVLRMNGFEERQ